MKRNIILSIIIVLLIAWSEIALDGQPPGRIIGWGYNNDGKIFGGLTNDDSMGYVSFEGHELTNVVAVAARNFHAMALKNDGTAVAWGSEPGNKVMVVPFGLGNVTAISLGGLHSLALKSDGTVACWGDDASVIVPAGLSNMVAISGGGSYTIALKKDGTLEKWGGPYGSPPAGLSNIISIATCRMFFGDDLALRKDGTVVEWPSYYVSDDDPYTMPPGLTNVVAIASGNAHALALKKDGTVMAWGFPMFNFQNPNYGQLNVPSGLSNVVAIAGGPSISLALKRDGTVVVWGDNHHHQVDLAKGLSNIVAIAAGQDFCLAIQAPGPITNSPPSLPSLRR